MENITNENLRAILSLIFNENGYQELSTTSISNNTCEEVRIKTITKGVFIPEEDTFTAVICNFVDVTELKEGLRSTLSDQLEIDNIYIGEKYLLCLANSKIYSFNVKLYEDLESLIDEVEDMVDIEFRRFTLSINSVGNHILIINTNVASFMLAGLISDSQEEEERVILSNKLENSQPFFAFKAPIQFNWDDLLGDKDRQFERICELLLQHDSKIISVIPIGKTRASDRGRDFEVIETTQDLSSSERKKWLVQCKFSNSSISASSISGWTDRVIEHKYDGFWLMTNNDITPNLFDQFKDVQNNEMYNIQTRFWQRSDFHIKLNTHSELFTGGDIFKVLDK